jgi:hypothetical protein
VIWPISTRDADTTVAVDDDNDATDVVEDPPPLLLLLLLLLVVTDDDDDDDDESRALRCNMIVVVEDDNALDARLDWPTPTRGECDRYKGNKQMMPVALPTLHLYGLDTLHNGASQPSCH